MTAFSLAEFPAHLGLGATVVREPRFTGADWYAAYGTRHASDGVEGRLVSMHTFTESWSSWETLHQEIDGNVRTVMLHAGEAVINPPGVWHTADVSEPCTALFVTAGAGTENRAR